MPSGTSVNCESVPAAESRSLHFCQRNGVTIGRKPLEIALLRRVSAAATGAEMFSGARGIGAAATVPTEANLLTCSCLPRAVEEANELGGNETADGAVDAKGISTKDAPKPTGPTRA
jgi:hypothetical protein